MWLVLLIDLSMANSADPEALLPGGPDVVCADFRDTSVYSQLDRIRRKVARAPVRAESGWGMFEGRDESGGGFSTIATATGSDDDPATDDEPEDEDSCWARIASSVTTLDAFWQGAFDECAKTEEQAYYAAADHLFDVPGGLDVFAARFPESERLGSAAVTASVRASNAGDVETRRRWMDIAIARDADLTPLLVAALNRGDLGLAEQTLDHVEMGGPPVMLVKVQIATDKGDWTAAEGLIQELIDIGYAADDMGATISDIRFAKLGEKPAKNDVRAWVTGLESLAEGRHPSAISLESAASRLPKKEARVLHRRIVDAYPESIQAAVAARALLKGADDADTLEALADNLERDSWWPAPLEDPELELTLAVGMVRTDPKLPRDPWDGDPMTLVPTEAVEAWKAARGAPAEDVCLVAELAVGGPNAIPYAEAFVIEQVVRRQAGDPDTGLALHAGERIIGIEGPDLPDLPMMREPTMRVSTVPLAAEVPEPAVSVEFADGIVMHIAEGDLKTADITAQDLYRDGAVGRRVQRALLEGRVAVLAADGQPYEAVVVTESGASRLGPANRRYALTDPDLRLFRVEAAN